MPASLRVPNKKSDETIMAYHRTGEFEEGFMNVSAPFVTHAQTPQVMEPGESALDHPAAFAKPTAMRHPSFCQQRPDAASHEFFSMRLRVISAVSLRHLRTPSRTASFAADTGDGIEQRQKLGNVVAVGSRQHDTQRHASAIGQQMMLGTRF